MNNFYIKPCIPKGGMFLYLHHPNPLSLSHNHYWIHSHNYDFPGYSQQPGFLPCTMLFCRELGKCSCRKVSTDE